MGKLIRDLIPEIIRKSNKECNVRVADDRELSELLKKKLLEEAHEFCEADSLEELADVLEVMMAILDDKSVSWQQLEEKRAEKAASRGRFKRKYVLEKT